MLNIHFFHAIFTSFLRSYHFKKAFTNAFLRLHLPVQLCLLPKLHRQTLITMALDYTTFTDARTQGVGNPLRGFRATIRHDRGEGRRFMLMTVKVLPSLTLKYCTLTSNPSTITPFVNFPLRYDAWSKTSRLETF